MRENEVHPRTQLRAPPSPPRVPPPLLRVERKTGHPLSSHKNLGGFFLTRHRLPLKRDFVDFVLFPQIFPLALLPFVAAAPSTLRPLPYTLRLNFRYPSACRITHPLNLEPPNDAQEWTALQNLPSLPRDLSAVDLLHEEELGEQHTPATPTLQSPPSASSRPTPVPPCPSAALTSFLITPLPLLPPPAASSDTAGAGAETTSGGGSRTEPGEGDAATPTDPVSVQAARVKAMAARAKAEEARRHASQKTAAATALTIHAKEILDAAVGSGSKGRGSGAAARAGAEAGAGARVDVGASSRESSGVQTPSVLSERGGRGAHSAADAFSGDVTSPPAAPLTAGGGHKRTRTGEVKSKAGGKSGGSAAFPSKARSKKPSPTLNFTAEAGDDTDMDDDEPPAQRSKLAKSRGGKKTHGAKGGGGTFSALGGPTPGGASGGVDKDKAAPKIQATDHIITASGKKIRRGCLNCQAIKTPQWRMGPEGPKTLCNACGVRYRKGLTLT